jgi:hypothetical protein
MAEGHRGSCLVLYIYQLSKGVLYHWGGTA